jgi:hypothetical protein
MTPEIRLTESPAHVRHGSNIGQPSPAATAF